MNTEQHMAAAMTIINDTCIEAMLRGEVGTGVRFWPIERSLRLIWHLRQAETLDANPDDLTSPDDLPDHALMTGQQFEDWAMEAWQAMIDAALNEER